MLSVKLQNKKITKGIVQFSRFGLLPSRYSYVGPVSTKEAFSTPMCVAPSNKYKNKF